ncbi:unnamed protein product [Candida verbasci]|uniref:MPN domain-containing protein n=1 Tax=Candida verbasci TaxID=1227364 RepID=A0A9W4TWV1_9ASCO|nr:unnamed protein product [Candida verbasci]
MSSFMHLVRPNVLAPAVSSQNTGPISVKIHSSALLTMLEIVSKQVLNNKRVLGSLLGYRNEDGLLIEIRDAFMVPINENGDSITIDEPIHKSIYQLYKKSHPKEMVLGWFGSSNKIDDNTSLIHDFYSKGVDRAYPHPAIYLNIEYLNEQGQIISPKIMTYIGANIGQRSGTTNVSIGWKTTTINNSYIFTPVPNEIINNTISEKIAFNKFTKQNITNNTSVSSEVSNLSHLEEQLNNLQENIKIMIKFIESTNEQDRSKDENIDLIRQLSNSILNKPQLLTNPENLTKLFNDHNQDVIMIEYLTKAIKDQIELSSRLTAAAEAGKDTRQM